MIVKKLFQRKYSSFQFLPGRALLNGENLRKLYDSYECVKNKPLTYTLCEYVQTEVDRLPENESSFNYDADNPYGLNEPIDTFCRCITKYIATSENPALEYGHLVQKDESGKWKEEIKIKVGENYMRIIFRESLSKT
ncbi:hypothetical protein TNCV_81501 [Trichonephila clavipes]|nr:hypothetical protein TNCV_81501 [Trichonephila clavipes]